MRNLSPQTRQKLAILLKSREAGQGLTPPGPNMMPPPPANGMSMPKPPGANLNAAMPQPSALNAAKMTQPSKFSALKSKLKPF